MIFGVGGVTSYMWLRRSAGDGDFSDEGSTSYLFHGVFADVDRGRWVR